MAILERPKSGSGFRVVGVLAPHFELLFPASANMERAPDVWIATRLDYDAANVDRLLHRVVGRLKTARPWSGRKRKPTEWRRKFASAFPRRRPPAFKSGSSRCIGTS
jgi:hypothetical protein